MAQTGNKIRELQRRIDGVYAYRSERTIGAEVTEEHHDVARDSRMLRELEHRLTHVEATERALEEQWFLTPIGMEEASRRWAASSNGHVNYPALNSLRMRLLEQSNTDRRKKAKEKRALARRDLKASGAKPEGRSGNWKPRSEWDNRWTHEKQLAGRDTQSLHVAAHAVLSNNVSGAERMLVNLVEKRHSSLVTVRMVAMSAENPRVREKALTVLATRMMRSEQNMKPRDRVKPLRDDSAFVAPIVDEQAHIRAVETACYRMLASKRYDADADDDTQAARVNAALAKEHNALDAGPLGVQKAAHAR
jgi:hypothetical protein